MTSTTPTEPEALAACPFCGESDFLTVSQTLAGGLQWWSVDCGCNAGSGPGETKAEAIAAWNRRIPVADPETLPCDVMLPPATTIRAGCGMDTLLFAMSVPGRPRHFATPAARMLAGEGEAVAFPENPYDNRDDLSAWRAWGEGFDAGYQCHPPAAEPVGVRGAVELALACTPQVRDGEIIYDCGDPWEILHAALATPARTDDAGEVDPELIDRVKYAVERPNAQGFLLAKASMTRHDFRRILATLSPAPDRGEGEA